MRFFRLPGRPVWNKMSLSDWLVVWKALKLDPFISPYTNINSNWVKYLTTSPKSVNLVQERVGNTLELIVIGKNFLNGTPGAQQQRDSTDKWDFIKLKSSAQQKEWSLN
jgi:hypothetical protein